MRSLRQIKDWILENKCVCEKCGYPFSDRSIMVYPDINGIRVNGLIRPQSVSGSCIVCGNETSLSAMEEKVKEWNRISEETEKKRRIQSMLEDEKYESRI